MCLWAWCLVGFGPCRLWAKREWVPAGVDGPGACGRGVPSNTLSHQNHSNPTAAQRDASRIEMRPSSGPASC
ncbi:hypothetical protein B0H11DRAFT_2060363 [Mycena galericulata]|nr:hypothetical protein B0H11DRAFT_2060363 [Mycena galericulata]